MARRMDYKISFDAPAEKIYQDFTSRGYWETLMDAYRFLTPQSEITRFASGDAGTDVVFKQVLPRMYLPTIARAFWMPRPTCMVWSSWPAIPRASRILRR